MSRKEAKVGDTIEVTMEGKWKGQRILVVRRSEYDHWAIGVDSQGSDISLLPTEYIVVGSNNKSKETAKNPVDVDRSLAKQRDRNLRSVFG